MESLCCWKTQRALCRCICVAFGQSWPHSRWQHYVIENLNNKLNGSGLIWMGDVAFHLDQSSFPLVTAPWTVFRWNAEDEWAQRGIHLFACWPMYIIYSLIVARHARIHNLHLLYFQIFHISRLRVIIHFSTTPVHRSFVVFVWIFNVWRWRVHGCSTLNVVIRWLVIEGNCSIRLALICSAPAFERCSVQN